MSDTPENAEHNPADARAVTDGGTEVAGGTSRHRTVADRTRSTSMADASRLEGEDQHLFGPAELPRWAMSLPLVGALAVVIGAQGTAVLATGAGSAWLGTVVAAIGMLVVVALALRAA